jgi:hypothetical protein
MAKHTKETLGFNSFSGYYASIAQGYGGFSWGDVDYMNATYWQNEKTEWCDTGFQNVTHGAGEAFTWNNNGSVSYGLFESANVQESFTLNSMVAASGWETDQPFDFKSYTYQKGKGFVLKASDTIYLSQTAQKIDFAKVGNPGDFKNIVVVEIVSGSGKYGNTCSYGPYSYTLGNQMAFDNLKVTWNGKIPKGNGKPAKMAFLPHGNGHAGHIATAHLVSGDAQHGTNPAAHISAPVHSGTQIGFHSELLPLGGSHTGDLTGQFQLPAIDHFGT